MALQLGEFAELAIQVSQAGEVQAIFQGKRLDGSALGNGLLSGHGWDAARGPGSAALPITLLLLSKAGVPCQGQGMDVAMGTLHEAMTLLSVTVDREIVRRMLQREDEATDPGLMQSLEELVRYSQASAKAPCLA